MCYVCVFVYLSHFIFICVSFTLYFPVCLLWRKNSRGRNSLTVLSSHLCNRPKYPLTQVDTVHDVVSVKPFISFKRMFQVQAALRFLVVCRTLCSLSQFPQKSLMPTFPCLSILCLSFIRCAPLCILLDCWLQVSQVFLTFLYEFEHIEFKQDFVRNRNFGLCLDPGN